MEQRFSRRITVDYEQPIRGRSCFAKGQEDYYITKVACQFRKLTSWLVGLIRVVKLKLQYSKRAPHRDAVIVGLLGIQGVDALIV